MYSVNELSMIMISFDVTPGNLMTDAMVAHYVLEQPTEGYWTNASIALLNSGGIRSPIEKGKFIVE